MLRFKDRVYGAHVFSEPVLIELIKSKLVQRLKGIAQWGVPDIWYHKRGYSRFEHTMGVTILLTRLGAPLKEQVAGVLHDISHTAFSHVIDWVIGNSEREDFQDKLFFKFLSSNDEIKNILEKHGFSLNEFKDLHEFPLLEQPIPNVCADRIDYCLREVVSEGDKKVAQDCLGGLIVLDEKICFNSKRPAKLFAGAFLKLQKEHWAGEQAVGRYYIMAKILNKAMREKIISFEDFFTNDKKIVDKLLSSRHPFIKQKIGQLLTGRLEPVDKEKKLRYVDPIYIQNGKKLRLSENDANFRKKLAEM